jgi:hypothetical protein
MAFRGARFGGSHFAHRNLGFRQGRIGAHHLAAGLVGAHGLSHLAGHNALHGASAFHGFGHRRLAGNAFASRIAWNHWNGWNRWRFRNHGWFGGIWWPFLYGDLLSFVLWPYYYDDAFWNYDYDSLLSGVFWPAAPAQRRSLYDVYGYTAADDRNARFVSNGERVTADAAARACVGLAPGVADLPIDRIEHSVHPSEDQVALLNDVRSASLQANTVLKASCAEEIPLTPVGRIDAMERRFEAVGQVVSLLGTPLAKFYDSLSQEQAARFEAIATPKRPQSTTALCDERTAAFSSLPAERIEQIVRPNEQQRNLLDALKAASSQAANALQPSCPADVPRTVAERLNAIGARAAAMSTAARTVRPALEAFYMSLDDEQKARFMTMSYPTQARRD